MLHASGGEQSLTANLEGRTALITGASRGIGFAVAEELARRGGDVVLCARGREDLDRAAEHIRDLGSRALAIVADVSREAEVDRLVSAARSEFGTIDIAVNNAGGVDAFDAFEDLSADQWRACFEANVMSAVFVTRRVLPGMRAQGWGRVINIASESAVQPDAFMPHYAAAKAALIAFGKSLSKAAGTDGVLVNTVSPAFIMTPLVDDLMQRRAERDGVERVVAEASFLAEDRPNIVLGRAGTSREVASAVGFLSGDDASFVTGTNLRVDGGSVASI